MNAMHYLTVQIIRFVDGSFPGWVECKLVDAKGRCHLIIEKVPMVAVADLDAHSKYPTPGTVACEVLKRYRDETGQELAQVSTARPWSIESAEGLSEFTVLANLLTSVDG
jgi:hypothetical protein